MNALGHVLFNLTLNSLGSFLLTLALVYGALRALRFEPGRCQLWLLLLPFAKLLLDLAVGVPESSFLWAKLAGQTQHLGWFRIGFGVSQFGPFMRFELGAFSGGLIYPQSLGDLIDAALARRVAPWFPGALAALVAGVGLTRLGLRQARSHRFMRAVLRDARVVERRRVGWREVAVLVSEGHTGVPFAAGLLRPRVVFSGRTHAAFTPAEREAVLRHELAHIAHGDLALLAGLRGLEAVFWFLPGSAGLLARIHAVLEQRADAAALAAGAQPLALASALVHAAEVLREPTPGAAMLSKRTLLEARVQRLLESMPRRTRYGQIAQLAVAALVSATVAQALFFGNHVSALVRFPIP